MQTALQGAGGGRVSVDGMPATPGDVDQKLVFLDDLAHRLDEEGNEVESVRAKETAIFLRRQAGGYAQECHDAVEQLAADCNARAVKDFNEDRYDIAMFLLKRAVFLTDASGETNCFLQSKDDVRRKLRAVTFNNLGCLEKRRGRFPEALAYLEEAAHLEQRIAGEPAPATAMNLCATLTKLGKTREALAAAEGAVASVLQQRARGTPPPAGVSEANHMYVVAFHNLAVAQEFSERVDDAKQAFHTFTQAAGFAHKHLGADHPTTRAVEASLLRYRTVTAPKRGIPVAQTLLPSIHDTASGGSTGASLPRLPSINQHAGATTSPMYHQPMLDPSGDGGGFRAYVPAGGGGSTSPYAAPQPRGGGKPSPARRDSVSPASHGTIYSTAPPPQGARPGKRAPRAPPGGTDRRRGSKPAPAPPSTSHTPGATLHSQYNGSPMSDGRSTTARSAAGAVYYPTAPDVPPGPKPGRAAPRREVHVGAEGSGKKGATPVMAPTPPTSTRRGVGGMTASGSGMDAAAQRHAERMHARTSRRDNQFDREERQRAMAKRIFEKSLRQKQRKEQEVERRKREEMAKMMYEKMSAGLKADEIRRYRNAARLIQKVWRGVMVRTEIERQQIAACMIQKAVRYKQARARHRKQLQKDLERQREAKLMAQRERAAQIIQRRVRCLFAKLRLYRIQKAKLLRRWYCARRIQRSWGRYRQRIELNIAKKEENLRRLDALKKKRLEAAARKIQGWVQMLRLMRVTEAKREQARLTIAAAVKIQRIWRGFSVRFVARRAIRGPRKYPTNPTTRLNQALIVLQKFVRFILARAEFRRRKAAKVQRDREALLSRMACTLQRAWRVHRSGRAARALRALKAKREAAALRMQCWWRRSLARARAAVLRENKRRLPAVLILQHAWRASEGRKKMRETEEYHRVQRAKQAFALKRTRAAINIQAWYRGCLGRRIARARLEDFWQRDAMACTIQRAWRCYAAKKTLEKYQQYAEHVAVREAQDKLELDAALVIQRNVRMWLACRRVAELERLSEFARVIQRFFLRIEARKTLARLRNERELKRRTRAARRIQRNVRKWLCSAELKRLEEYYNGKRLAKLRDQRQHEAALAIQSAWRSYIARKTYALRKDELRHRILSAITVQRFWRTVRFRVCIVENVEQAIQRRRAQVAAATKIQSAWRRFLAEEFTQMLREVREVELDAAMHIQCWWRQRVALREASRRRALKAAAKARAQAEAEGFENSLLMMQAAARCVLSQFKRNELVIESLRNQIANENSYATSVRYGAAVTIQKVFRGHSDRLYHRALVREKREREAKEKAELERQAAAVLTIQLFYRRVFACREVAALREARRVQRAKEAAEYEMNEKPADLVKQLFWEMETRRGINLKQRADAERRKRDEAATRIQCLARRVHARAVTDTRRRQKVFNKAAGVIQNAWAVKRRELDVAHTAKVAVAVVRIQSLYRCWAAKRRTAALREAHLHDIALSLETEEAIDAAVVAIQSFWRLVMAKKRTAAIVAGIQAEKDEASRQEAALFVQKVYRGRLGRKRAAAKRLCRETDVKEAENRQFYPANSNVAHKGGPWLGDSKHTAAERDAAAVKVQCAVRQRQARNRVAEERAEKQRLLSSRKSEEAAGIIQGAWRLREARQEVADADIHLSEEDARLL